MWDENFDLCRIPADRVSEFEDLGRCAGEILIALADLVEPGRPENDLCKAFLRLLRKAKASSALEDIAGFPNPMSISTGSTICRGVPDPDCAFVNGDVVKIDIAIKR